MSHCGGLVIKFVSDSCRLLCPWDSLGKNTGVGCHFLLQEISPTRESNLYLLHCKETLYLTLYFIWATGKPLCPTMISQNLWILCDITPVIILCDCKTGRLSKWIWLNHRRHYFLQLMTEGEVREIWNMKRIWSAITRLKWAVWEV